MDHESYQRDWLVKAKNAGFLPFEVIEPAPSSSTLGGLGGGSGDQLHLDIAHVIDGHEMFIETTVGAVRSDSDSESEDRRTVIDAVEGALDSPLRFPLTLHLLVEVRTVEILVDGTAMQFRGIVVAGVDDWMLRAEISEGTTVSIQGSGDCAPTAIRRRTELDIEGLTAAR